MTPEERSRRIVELMFENDAFSKNLDMQCEEIRPGECTLTMEVTDDMLNGFGVAHGGITYALSDSALAFASNSHGKKCMSIDTQISHLKPTVLGDILTATTKEVNRSRNLARYIVEVVNQTQDMVAHFQGTVFIKDENWEISD